MPDEVFCDGTQAGFSREQMNFLGEFRFQFFLLIGVDVRLLDRVQNPVGDFGIVQITDFFSAVLIIQRNGSGNMLINHLFYNRD